jgi:hypothetical protein
MYVPLPRDGNVCTLSYIGNITLPTSMYVGIYKISCMWVSKYFIPVCETTEFSSTYIVMRLSSSCHHNE